VTIDKTLPGNSSPSLGRRLPNLFSTVFGTDINLRMDDIASGLPREFERDEPSIRAGMYRLVLVREPGEVR